MDFVYVIESVVALTFASILALGMSISFIYLSEVFERLKVSFWLTKKMLSGMHEGVFLFTKEDLQAICYNEEAGKLIKTFHGESTDIEQILSRQVFQPMKQLFYDGTNLN